MRERRINRYYDACFSRRLQIDTSIGSALISLCGPLLLCGLGGKPSFFRAITRSQRGEGAKITPSRAPPNSSLWIGAANGRMPFRPAHMFTDSRGARVKRFAQAALGTALLASLLAGILPLETLASGQMCALACCAGRAPHASGSCMDGSCHAAIKVSKQKQRSIETPREQFCGFAALKRQHTSKRAVNTPPLKSETESKEPHLSSATITEPCAPDCGTCGSRSTASDYRNHAVAAERQRPATAHHPELTNTDFAFLSLTALVRQCAPRAPPDTL